MKTVKIKGKDYVMVKDRINYFHENYLNGSIKTELIEMTDRFIFKAIVTPDLKNQFATEYNAARDKFSYEDLTLAERNMYDRYNRLGFREEDLAGADLDVYKSLRNKLSQNFGSRASNIFNQLNPDLKQVDSETARQQIEAVGIPTPDPVKILQGLESEGIALTEGQKKIL